MTKRTDLVEYEQMILARHTIAGYRADRGVGRSAYLLMSRLEAQGPMTIAEFSEALGLDVSTLQRQTTAALTAGLLDRIPDPDGGMARKFVLTEEGLRRLHAERATHVEGLDRILMDWSEEDVDGFVAVLKRFNQDLERYSKRVWPR